MPTVLVLGAVGSGKTTYLELLSTGIFNPSPRKEDTKNSQYFTIYYTPFKHSATPFLGGVAYNFIVQDCVPGQVINLPKGVDACLVFYKLTSRKSRDAACWLRTVCQHYYPEKPVVVCGTHADSPLRKCSVRNLREKAETESYHHVELSSKSFYHLENPLLILREALKL